MQCFVLERIARTNSTAKQSEDKNIKHVMTGLEGNKMNCFLRDQSLSDLVYSWKF